MVTANTRAFRVLVRNALFHRVGLAALATTPNSATWMRTAGGIRRVGRTRWTVTERARRARQWAAPARPGIADHRPAAGPVGRPADFDDPAGDHDWGISAVIDLTASDEAGSAVLRITDVGQL